MQVCNKIENILIYIYEAFLFVIFPLWIPYGYNDLANDKYDFFMLISVIMLLLMSVLKILSKCIYVIMHIPAEKKSLHTNKNLYLLIMLFATSLIISTMISDYRQHAFMGVSGWYMGLFTYLIYFSFFFMCSKRTNWNPKITFWLQYVGSLAINVIAVLNRFYIYPIKGIENIRYFISTIGNINWYAGYLCLFLFVNVSIFLTDYFENKKINIALLFYMIIGSFCLFSCGSQSVYLFAASFFTLAILFSLSNHKSVSRLTTIFIVFAVSAESFALTYNYVFHWNDALDTSVITKLIRFHLGLPIILIMVLIKKYNAKMRFEFNTRNNYFVIALMLCSPLLLLVIQITPLYTFPTDFGNGRGFIWNISREVFYNLSFKQKLFGIGPDSLAYYLYRNDWTSDILYAQYGNTLLTNSHSILLNDLLNWGIIPLLCYLLLNYHIIISNVKEVRKYTFIVISLMISSYLFGMISFDNILFTTYVYYLISLYASCT